MHVPCGFSTRSCCVRHLLQCLTFEKAEGGFQSHRTNFKLRQRFVFLQALSALNEGMLLADAEEIFFSIENWISGIKLVNVNKDRSLLVSSQICKLQEMECCWWHFCWCYFCVTKALVGSKSAGVERTYNRLAPIIYAPPDGWCTRLCLRAGNLQSPRKVCLDLSCAIV